MKTFFVLNIMLGLIFFEAKSINNVINDGDINKTLGPWESQCKFCCISKKYKDNTLLYKTLLDIAYCKNLLSPQDYVEAKAITNEAKEVAYLKNSEGLHKFWYPLEKNSQIIYIIINEADLKFIATLNFTNLKQIENSKEKISPLLIEVIK